MSRETFGGLLWNSRAGVLVQAMDMATHTDRSDRKHKSGAGTFRSRETRFNGAWYGLPVPVAAAGMVFIGCILGAALVLTLTA